jgi:hypothetical protein
MKVSSGGSIEDSSRWRAPSKGGMGQIRMSRVGRMLCVERGWDQTKALLSDMLCLYLRGRARGLNAGSNQ